MLIYSNQIYSHWLNNNSPYYSMKNENKFYNYFFSFINKKNLYDKNFMIYHIYDDPINIFSKDGNKKQTNNIFDEMINNIRNELNVKPFVNGDYGGGDESFKIYNENENKFYLPKFYGIEKFGNPDVNILPEGKDIDIQFSLDLKDEQKIPAEKTIEAYNSYGGGILSLPCGFGKTILALYFISVLKKKTLVIVHKEFLMNQWIERIKFALPSAKVGIVQGDKCQIDDNDIIIGMLQTLSMKEFAPDTFDDIGHVIIDECHTISSRVFPVH